MKEEGSPFNIVFERIFDTNNVIITPSTITPVNNNIETMDWKGAAMVPAKNMVIIAINVGKRPLHGTKLLVIIAISRSLGESIILHPIIPAALQPKPMHIVKACFP